MKGKQTKKNHRVFTIIAYSIFYSRVWGSSVHDMISRHLFQVGTFLKTPQYPVWVVGSETHLTVAFSTVSV